MAYPKVTIVGAGNVGATAGMILAMKNIADVVLCDVVEGMPQGKALDLMHMRSNEKYGTTITGTNDYADTADSDVVVITAGVARKPGMTREDLIGINSKIMLDVIGKAKAASPNAIFICVTNPLDVMTYLAFKNAGVPKNRLMGMGGVLDSARYAYAIAEATGESVDDIVAYAVGAHGQSMVTLPRFSTVKGQPLTGLLTPEQIEAVRAFAQEKGYLFRAISAATRQGLEELPGLIWNQLQQLPPVPQFQPEFLPPEPQAGEGRAFTITHPEPHVFEVEAPWLERILAGSDVEDYESLQYFQRQLGESGILDELVRQGVEEEDTIRIGEYEFDYIF